MLTKFQLTGMALITALTACGNDDSKDSPTPDAKMSTDGQTTPYSMALATTADLPACDDSHNQQLVYVIDAKQFKTCQAGQWVDIAVQMKDEIADPAAVKNALASIELGAAWDSVPAIAKTALTSKDSKVQDFTNTVCGSRVEKFYILGGYDFKYDLTVYNGKVVSYCSGRGTSDEKCQQAACN